MDIDLEYDGPWWAIAVDLLALPSAPASVVPGQARPPGLAAQGLSNIIAEVPIMKTPGLPSQHAYDGASRSRGPLGRALLT